MDPGEATSRDGRSVAVRCDVPDGPAVRGPGRLLFGQPLDLNRATAASLEALPGIGPSRAAAIVSERERRPFQRVGDLQRVRGIGPRTLEGLDGLVTVGGAPGGRDR
jgi:competence ComEA-like helix-hairpin-helix protein